MRTCVFADNLTTADRDRYQYFRISDELIELHEIRRVTSIEARDECGIHYKGDLSGLVYPMFGADDAIKGYRLRRDNPEIDNGKPKAKYVQSVDRTHLYFERSSRRFLDVVSVPVLFVEAYTSALAIAALAKRTDRQFLIVATAGCWGWRGRIGKTENEKGSRVDEKGPLPDLDHISLRNRKVIICFDANVETNVSVQAAERAFSRELEKRGAVRHLARLPKESAVNGPDDYIARHSDEDFIEILENANYEAWPEPKPVRAALRAVVPLHAELIPISFRDWLTDISTRMQCPLDFVAVGAIVASSSVIGAGCGVRPKQHDDWTVVPNLWGGVVGRPSIVLKSPSLQEVVRPLERLASDAREQYEAACKSHDADMEAYKAQRESIKKMMGQAAQGKKQKDSDAGIDMAYAKAQFMELQEPAPPKWRRYKTNDATIEKLGELLADNPRGLLVFRDELIALFSSWDQQGHESDRAFFLECWNGNGSHDTDRIGRGSIRVEHACISLLGGIQPAKLQTYLYGAMRGHDNDGLVQRLQLLVYPDEPPLTPIVDRHPDVAARNKVYAIIGKLADANFEDYGATVEENCIPYFHFDANAQQFVYEWLEDLNYRLRADEDEAIITEHLGKYRSLMPSLALIFHLGDVASGAVLPGPIPAVTARRAMAWCDYLESHARRIYGLVTNVHVEAAVRLSRRILAGELGEAFTLRDVYRKHWGLLDDKDIAESACDELVALGWLREEIAPAFSHRPRSTEYVVNPRIKTSGTSGTSPSGHLEEKI
jgi:hypothetical protein